MNEMIERIAKDIHDRFGNKSILEYEDNKTFYRNIARAAIEAMKEPTEEMVNAAGNGEYFIEDICEDICEDIYKNMIEAALK